MSEHDAPKDGTMRRRVFAGAGWAGFSQIAVQLTRTAVAIVIARLLTPEEYGLAALTLVFSSLVMVFSDLALGAALVQRKTLSEDDRSTAFWMTITAGVLFMFLGFALSGPISEIYGQPKTQPLFAVLSVSFLISSLGATQQSLLLREMAFRRLEGLTIVGALAAAPVAVVLAASGAGPWAIIGQQIAIAAFTSALMWRASSWRPSFRFSKKSLRDLWSFSGYLVGHRLLFYVNTNADNFIIGRFIGPAAVGAYAIAYNVMLAPAARIGAPLQRVLAPTFSRMQDEPQRIAEAWAKVTRMIAAIAVPALAGVIVVADEFIAVLLGPKWESVAPIIQVLAWVGILQALQSINVDILMARGRTRAIFRYTMFFVTVHVTAFLIGAANWGVMGLAVAFAVTSTFVEPILSVITARELKVSPLIIPRAVFGVFQAAAGMVAVLLLARPALIDAGVPTGARLVLLVILGIVLYVPLCAWRAPEVLRDARSLIPARLSARFAPLARPAEG